MSSIFLSHSSQDNTIAGQVKARLEQWGHRSVFLDFDPEHGIPAGREWEKELYAKLRECRAVIILCSHASMASRWCFAEITHAKALGKPVFPIKIDDSKVDPILTDKQIVDATAGWDEACRRLEKGLLAAGLDPKDLFDWDHRRPPYPGLAAFQEQDAVIFFGRNKEIRDGQALLNRLQQFGGPRLTLLLGASGSGKSSLMRAGLLPRLKRDQRWAVIDPFRPLVAPFDELARALSQRFGQIPQAGKGMPRDVASIRGRIQWDKDHPTQSTDTFLDLINELRETIESREATVLLMIDQCEELLAVGANEDGDRFLTFLRAVLDREDNRLMVLVTLRSDFLGSFQDHPAMRGLRVETFPVPQMEVDDFASVIEGPARIAGLELGPGLVQAMIGDTKTSDALPLLAFSLRELYESFGEDKLLTLEEYRDKLGGLDGCIARAAEEVLSAKPLSEKEVLDLRIALLSMARVNDRDQYAKQPVLWNDLRASTHKVLERFVTARLLILGVDEKGRTLEVAHEALFRAWPRFVDWLKDDKSFLVWQQRLRGSIWQYEEREGNSDFLLRGFPLSEALEWIKKKPVSFSRKGKEWEFVTASHRHRNHLRRGVAIVASLVLMVIGGTTWLWQTGYTIHHLSLKVQSIFAPIHVEPEMVLIEGDTFLQGSDSELAYAYEKPVHNVTIKRFAIGKYEVTFEEYDRFELATGSRLPIAQEWGRGRRPVINVSWNDAIAYAKWLSERTDKRYRLPTESQWEFAARSGPKQDNWAGTSKDSELGNYAVFYNNANFRTAERGSKDANHLGLHDLSGNVWEWVEDCWHQDYYKGAPSDGAAWLDSDAADCIHVFRGGSWRHRPRILRASNRGNDKAQYSGEDLGFRLAREIP